jgi:predicted nucleic acid-binding protein
LADLLVDTDVFIDHLRGHRPLAPGKHRIFYSTITRAELFAGRGADEEPIRLLLSPFAEVAVDRAIAERGGRLRRGTSMALPDALIAATALERGLALMTRNTREFERVDGLKVRSPGAS